MKLDFHCLPLSRSTRARALVFAWDPDAGTVDGPDAALVREMAAWPQVAAHPIPWAWRLSADPLRSFTDMAAIVGSEWHLPPELADHYPRCPPHELPRDENSEWLPGFCYEPSRPAARQVGGSARCVNTERALTINPPRQR